MQIHHYTTVENLALILKYRTIRFKRLDLVDDRLEGDDFGLYNPLKYFFASCWTKDDIENIALWKMYSSIEYGVKISLKIDSDTNVIFKKHPITTRSILNPFMFNGWMNDQVNNLLNSPDDSNWIDRICKYSPLRPEQYSSSDYILVARDSNDVQFVDVIYRDDFLDFYRDSIISMNGLIGYHLHNDWGVYKKNYWSFQKESRFLIQTRPSVGEGENIISKTSLNKEIKTNYIDVDLNDNAFNNMIITYAPISSEAQKIIIQSLTKDYPSIELKESALKDEIRN
jgi:hypothetical protein